MRPYRHGWLAADSGDTCGRGIFNTLLHVDVSTGEIRRRVLGKCSYTGEPIFIPRGAGEGEGYLLSTLYHADSGVSELLLLDALRIDAEPIAVIPTPQRIPFGFHGTFVPADASV
jgi:carotenoid cleavage dioxygenase